MFCKNCGSQIDDTAMFCPHCGVATSGAVNNSNSNMHSQINSIAIVGFILSFFIAIAGLVCSIIGYKSAPQYNGNGKGFALAGIIISSVIIVLYIIVYVTIFASLFFIQ